MRQAARNCPQPPGTEASRRWQGGQLSAPVKIYFTSLKTIYKLFILILSSQLQ
jgi:hypothetical protein